MSDRFEVHANIPHGSADAEWHICDMESDNNDSVVLVDPNMIYVDALELAERICRAMNAAERSPTRGVSISPVIA